VDRTSAQLRLLGARKRLSAKVEVARISAEITAADLEVMRCFGRELRRLKGAPAALKRQLKAGLFSRPCSGELCSSSHNDEPKASLPRKMIDSHTSYLPIVFIHRSNSDYLKYVFAQAQATNPQSPVILIGDRSNDCYDFVIHREIDEFFQGAAEFEKIYSHFSTHPPSYELICFQRWFILRDFLLANKIRRCLYLDSDMMLYTDVTQDSEKFAHFDFTLTHQTNGCIFFLNRVEALGEFCQFLMDVYGKRDRYLYDKLVAHYAVRRRHGLKGGVCDMTAFQLYSENHFGDIGEVAQIIDGSVYDPGITISRPGFEMEGGVKKIVWRNGLPYGKHVRTGREIRFKSLHFQGSGTKSLISEFYTGKLD
jgi:hypothetical protein